MLSFNDVRAASLSVSLAELSAARGGAQAHNVYHARVVDFSSGKAVLNIDGRTIVAESEVPLKLGGEFDLVVKGTDDGGRVHLQVMGSQESSEAPIKPLSDGMISSRLIGFDLPDHPATVESARALMRYGVAVTKANMEDMLMALPQTADKNMVEFAAAVIKEGLPLSRDLLHSLPAMKRDLEALPSNMKAVGDAVFRAVQQPAADQTGSHIDSASLNSFLQQLAAPSGDDPAAIAELLPNFIRGFLQSTESRLQALTEIGLTQVPGADARSSFVDQLLTMLKVIPQSTPPDTASIERALQSLAAQINDISFSEQDAQTFEPLRSALNESLSQSLDLKSPAARLDAARASISQILAQAIELETAAGVDPRANSYPSIFNSSLAALPRNFLEATADFQNILQQLQANDDASLQPDQAAVITKEQVVSTVARLAPLLNFKFDAEANPQINEFLKAAAQFSQQALKSAADAPDQNVAKQLASNPDAAAAAERLRTILDSPAFKREIEFLGRNFNNLPDVRMALSRSETAQDMPVNVMRNLSAGLQSANVANLVHHTGSGPLDSYVTFFPIQVGDRVEIGKLKIYRREEELTDKKKGIKPLNPFDSHLVIILDTEFLGLTSIALRTYPNKGIKCDIEVQDNRRRKVLEKHADELREGLNNTAYQQNTVAVGVRRRKTGTDDAPPDSPPATAVDFRI
ncbi:MAG: hypothetical protein WCX65_02485 [bacterium]